jgi:hypothetical protein
MPTIYKSLTPYRNREARVDFIWEVKPQPSVKVTSATLVTLPLRETKEVKPAAFPSGFGDLGLKRLVTSESERAA